MLFFSLAIFAPANLIAQDAIFSQHFASPLYLNPAFAGTGADYRIVMNYRNKPFPDFGTFSTVNFAADIELPSIYSGLGLLVTSDHQGGLMMKNNISAIYAYHLQVTNNLFINFGAQGGYYRKDLNWNNLVFAGDNNNQFETPPDDTWTHALDLGTGILVYTDRYYGGIAVHHLTEPRESFYGDYTLPMKYTAHLGMFLEPTSQRRSHTLPFNYFISPNLILQNQGDFFRLNYGFYAGIRSLMAGVWYRHDLRNPDTIIFLLGLSFDNYRIGYSYDYSMSGFTSALHGAHEISISLQFSNPARNLRNRIINCPSF